MDERDLDRHPYSEAEQRICAYLTEVAGTGFPVRPDDPVRFLLLLHSILKAERDAFKMELEALRTTIRDPQRLVCDSA